MRQNLYNYQAPRYDLPFIIAESLAPYAPRVITDVGCGNGTFTTYLRRVLPPTSTIMGIDIADGILAGMVSPVMCADASALPLEDNCCDAVLAMHMLYHVPNISIAISEFDRALSSHGLLISSTNFVDDKRELDELWTRAVGDVLGTLDPPKRVKLSRRYLLEDANAVLSSHFSNISTQHLTGVITITDSAPLVAHLASYRPFAASAGIPFTETVARVKAILDEHLAHLRSVATVESLLPGWLDSVSES